jgi:hypothetical protein
MKSTARYPKVIIHHLGASVGPTVPRNGLNLWLRLFVFALLVPARSVLRLEGYIHRSGQGGWR